MTNQLRTGLVIDGNAAGAKAAAAEAVTAVKGLAAATRDATSVSTARAAATDEEIAAVMRLRDAEVAATREIIAEMQLKMTAMADDARMAKDVAISLQAQIDALTKVDKSHRSAAASAGMMAAQLNDVAMMAIAGQNPMMTAIQQGSQMAQSFGAGGAAGAVAQLKNGLKAFLSPTALATVALVGLSAAAVQWVQDALGGGAATVSFADDIKDLESSVAEFAKGSQVSLDQIKGKYGQVDAALLVLLRHQREQRAEAAQDATRKVIADLADQYGVATGALNLFAITGKGEGASVAQALGLSKDAMVAFQKALRDAQNATNFDDQASAMGRLDAILAHSTISGGELAAGVTGAALALREAAHQADLTGQAAQGAADGIKSAETSAGGLSKGLQDVGAWARNSWLEANALASSSQNSAANIEILGNFARNAADAMASLVGAAPGDGWLASAIGQADTLAARLWDAVVAADAARTTNPTVTRLPGGVDAIASGDISITSGHAYRIAPPEAPTGSDGGGGAGRNADAVQNYLNKQQEELDLLRETDPVQKEIIRNRELLASVTDEQRLALEEAIRAGVEEKAALEAQRDSWEFYGSTAEQALEDIFLSGKKAGDVIADLGEMMAKATLKAALLGEGPLAKLMGTAGGGGILGALGGSGAGILGSLFGLPAKAGGGLVTGPGGPRDDAILMWGSNGEYMINAEATARNLPLLEAINAGALPRFADGGLVGHSSAASWSHPPQSRPVAVHNHFNITTPNARSFAEDRIAVARGASRLVAQAGRYS